MVQVTFHDLQTKKNEFHALGIKLPDFDIEEVWKKTRANPIWVHIGGGNLFRAYHAVLQQRLLEKGETDRGIIVVSTIANGLIEHIYQPHDNLSLNVSFRADGSYDMEIVASVAESIQYQPESHTRLKEIFRNPSLQLVTLTITEKGYKIHDVNGKLSPSVITDLKENMDSPRHTMVLLASLLYERYNHGAPPLALVSTDNFSANGDVLKKVIVEIASFWVQKGIVETGFLEYLTNPKKITYPWSMIDKITPHPSPAVSRLLEEMGIENAELIEGKAGASPIAVFTNTEEAQYLVIEDSFPNGRPPLEKAGVYMTTREVVSQVERMKVCTCLNPLHTALAIFGCLLGYKSIAREMKDPDLKVLIKNLAFLESMKVVADPGIINPHDFINEVIEVRFPNPNIPDTPQRIAADTSQKLPVRFGETIKLYMQRDDLHVDDLEYIPFVFAGWCRYLMGLDDTGKPFVLSPDPLLEDLQKHIKRIKFGDPKSVKNHLRPILSNAQIFGVNLYESSLGNKVEDYFKQMIQGPGAVRKALQVLVKS